MPKCYSHEVYLKKNIFVQEEENQDSYVDEKEDFITIRD
jgi:hypothetical protein